MRVVIRFPIAAIGGGLFVANPIGRLAADEPVGKPEAGADKASATPPNAGLKTQPKTPE